MQYLFVGILVLIITNLNKTQIILERIKQKYLITNSYSDTLVSFIPNPTIDFPLQELLFQKLPD